MSEPTTSPAARRLSDPMRLVLASFLMLFLELALIRWTGSNIIHLSYFSNFVLLGSFLGIGLGFLRAHHRVDLFSWAPVALAALVGFVAVFPVQVDNRGRDLVFLGYGTPTGLPREVTLSVVFVAVALTMTFIAEGVARLFPRFDNLDAYKYDLIGSLAGIVGFSALAFLHAPPLAWGGIAAVTFGVLLADRVPSQRVWMTGLQALALVAVLGALAVETFNPENSWSPYYKVRVAESKTDDGRTVYVNGVPHQTHTRTVGNSLYNQVYEHMADPEPQDVLIIGAGSGNDVSAALAHQAGRVDAVDIDPRMLQIGEELHPEHPYDDKRVHPIVDDGRAFLERTDRTYDLVVFALPDSITLVAGQSSLRLESYLFTKEALTAAKDRLKPGGVLTLYNYYREQWVADRFNATLDKVFGRPPCQIKIGEHSGLGLNVLVASTDTKAITCPDAPRITGAAADVATDDHPFPYLLKPTIPRFYLVTMALILIVSLLAVRGVAGPFAKMRSSTDLFFMGAAFLLLETKSVVQFALLFGTTWFVNALVFAGVLVSVLAAVALSQRVRIRRPATLYLVLVALLVLAFVVPLSSLLGLPIIPRFVAAVALGFGPIFVANLVFTERFRDVGDSTTAFGANLLGAMVGGLLEYGALITGYRLLLVLVAVLYGLAFLTGRTQLKALANR